MQGPEPVLQCFERGYNGVEGGLIEADEVHLVDGEHELADAKHAGDGGMTAGLRQQAVAGVHQQDGEVCGGGAGDHVAGVLVVARGIGQDETPQRRFEIAVGDVDGDALLALGGQAINQQRVINTVFHRAETAAVAFQALHHIVWDAAAFEQQPADQGRFAVIDAAARQDAKDGIGHQKYPSRFFFSIEES